MNDGTPRLKILFLCTGNAARSQMAEGWARHMKAREIEPYSAGTQPAGLSDLAAAVMAEAGVDISRHRSKHVGELEGIDFDYVVTLCDSAAANCPTFPGKAAVVHVPLPDPPHVRAAEAAAADLAAFRRVRDAIRAFVETLPQSLRKT